jgi:hypothetical protein
MIGGWDPPAHLNCECELVEVRAGVVAPPDSVVVVDPRLVEQMRPACEWREQANIDAAVCGAAASWILWDRCHRCGNGIVNLICDPHFGQVVAGAAWYECAGCGHVGNVHGARAERL